MNKQEAIITMLIIILGMMIKITIITTIARLTKINNKSCRKKKLGNRKIRKSMRKKKKEKKEEKNNTKSTHTCVYN